MSKYPLDLSLATIAGMTLAIMIALNSSLAAFSSPLLASWAAHGIGAITAFGISICASWLKHKSLCIFGSKTTRYWAYLGGIPGAMTVVLAAITVNSPLGLSGSITLIMAGQILFSMICDTFGLMGLPKRTMSISEWFSLCLMGFGCLLVLFGQGA